jgi:hypothetical protein
MNKAFMGEQVDKAAINGIGVSELQHMMTNRMNYLMFILLPIFAYSYKLIFRNLKLNFAESIVFSFYVLGFGMFLSSLLVFLAYINFKLWTLRFILIFGYYIYAMMQFSGEKSAAGFFKSLLSILLSYFMYFIVVIILILAYVKFFH